MHETRWQLLPKALADDTKFKQALINVHRDIYDEFFEDNPLINSSLGFHLHDYQRTSGWRVVLILTPWMMSRLLFPENNPHIVIPDGWSGEERCSTDYQVLGPSLRLGWSGNYMQSHLNFHAQLGHYLIQPILMNMQNYKTPQAALAAWNAIIRRRDAKINRRQLSCPCQEEFTP
jgi:hypothetical protein